MLLGRNGCGKSTLIRALLGLIPSKGDIFFEDRDLRKCSNYQRARLFSYLPQHQHAPSGVSVIDYVSMPAGNPFRQTSPESKKLAMNELAHLNLDDLARRHISTLSGGELRLAGLARARTQGSKLMIMDEPLAGLDFTRQHQFMKQACSDSKPVLMSVHDPVIAWQYADEILFMHDGVIENCHRNDEKRFESLLKSIYGPEMGFISAGEIRLPVWKND